MLLPSNFWIFIEENIANQIIDIFYYSLKEIEKHFFIYQIEYFL